MEFYLVILVVLFATAIADLYVGVANDAVNFVNSAIGSKAGSRFAIMLTASIGVIVGTTFSSGMMEVAQSGIFNPSKFTFQEVMIIFLAVMLTDIILLDLYNSFGLPTSTTVSLVFELIGGAIAMSLIKVSTAGGHISEILSFLNTGSVLVIVSSIGLSVMLAFFTGIIVQFFVRLIFTFDFEARLRRYGALYAALGLSGISYFILVKGSKGSTLLSYETISWIDSNTFLMMSVLFLILAVAFQLIILFTRINILKIVVFAGTFALSLSFAANDLVNFMGASMAGLKAYQLAFSGGAVNETLLMSGLEEPARANPWYLVGAGIIMVLTLWFSKKARTVTKTEVSLGRQENGGPERFSSSALARALVNIALALHGIYQKAAPARIQKFISDRIDPSKAPKYAGSDGLPPAFDMLRAATNLLVGSALISIGTSLKLPLSTTFVTFMVAMSTSLADRAWGRESAVNRVNGVLTVIGGWFVTAVLAFVSCFTMTYIIFYGKLPAIALLVFTGFYFYYRNTKAHDEREARFAKEEAEAKSQN